MWGFEVVISAKLWLFECYLSVTESKRLSYFLSTMGFDDFFSLSARRSLTTTVSYFVSSVTLSNGDVTLLEESLETTTDFFGAVSADGLDWSGGD